MSLQYKTIDQLNITKTDLDNWCNSRDTSLEVGLAIHAIADKNRSPEAIWDNPTDAEWDHVLMAIENYVNAGLFDPASQYFWGKEQINFD